MTGTLDDLHDYALALSASPPWHRRAACRDHPTLDWFPSSGDTNTEALQVCRACPVRAECAEAGRDEEHGIWGGRTARDRRLSRRAERADRRGGVR